MTRQVAIGCLLIFIFISRTVSALDLFYTSDLHGALSNLPSSGTAPAGLLHLRSAIIKEKQKSNALWLDGGGLMLGSAESRVLRRHNPFVPMLVNLGMDLVVPDAADLFALDKRLPWTSANLYVKNKLRFPPYRIFIRDKKKIAVLGLSDPSSLLGTQVPNDLQITSPGVAAKTWVPQIRKAENPDLLIVVTHIRRYASWDLEATGLEGLAPVLGAQNLAESVPGIGLLLYGRDHKHSSFLGIVPFSGGTVMAHGSSYGRDLLVLGWHAGAWTSRVIEAQSLPAEQIEQSLGKSYWDAMHTPLGLRLKRTSAHKLGLCLNEVLATAVNSAEVVGSALPIVYLKGRQTGPLTIRNLYQWFPFEDHLQKIQVSQRDLALLAHPAVPYGRKKAPYSRKVYIKLNQRVNLDLESGGTDLSQRKRHFWLYISDYHLQGGGGIIPMLFTHIADQSEGPSLREEVAHFFQQHMTLPPVCSMLQYI